MSLEEDNQAVPGMLLHPGLDHCLADIFVTAQPFPLAEECLPEFFKRISSDMRRFYWVAEHSPLSTWNHKHSVSITNCNMIEGWIIKRWWGLCLGLLRYILSSLCMKSSISYERALQYIGTDLCRYPCSPTSVIPDRAFTKHCATLC